MRFISGRAAALLILGAAAGLGSAHAAPAAAMSGSLRSLVNEWETADPRLASRLKVHLKSPSGDPLVNFHLQQGVTLDQVLPRLKASGFRLTAQSVIDPSFFEGYLPLGNARQAQAISGIRTMRAVHTPRRSAGSVQSQAVALEKANIAQSSGFNGAGIRIGALSDSFDGCDFCATPAPDDVASGVLPAGVTVLEELYGQQDEGRAMLQLVHDIAPASKLAFATAFNGEIDFSNNIIALRKQFKADVLVDDVGYFDEPMYSDGLVAQAIDMVVKDGAAYFSSAGNNGLEAYESKYFGLPFKDAQAFVKAGLSNLKLDQIPANLRPKSFHVFGLPTYDGGKPTLSQRFASAADNSLILQWDEPFNQGKIKTDYNIYVFDANGNWIDPNTSATVFYTTDVNSETDLAAEYAEIMPDPSEVRGGANQTNYQIVIGKMNDGPAEHIKYIVDNGLGVSKIQGAPSVVGHPAARGALAVGAAYYAIPNFPEDFSSPGPVTIYFDAKGNRLSTPEIRQVPQITGIDGVDTTFFGFDTDNNGLPNFFGTSAAAPDAAAVAALALQAAGGPGSIRPDKLYALLQRTATPMPTPTDRSWSSAQSGPLTFLARGDWSRWENFFGLGLHAAKGRSVASIRFDSADSGLVWSTSLDRFYLGDSNGVARKDVSVAVTGNQKTLTLNFAKGSFTGDESFHFGMSLYDPRQNLSHLAPDRLRGMRLTVKMDDGSTFASVIRADQKLAVNRFTGAGMVNAAAATREAQQRSPALVGH